MDEQGDEHNESSSECRDRTIGSIRRGAKLRKARKQRKKYRRLVVIRYDEVTYRVVGPYGEKKYVRINRGPFAFFLLLDAIAEVTGIRVDAFDHDGNFII